MMAPALAAGEHLCGPPLDAVRVQGLCGPGGRAETFHHLLPAAVTPFPLTLTAPKARTTNTTKGRLPQSMNGLDFSCS
jgi:hypothetical protein